MFGWVTLVKSFGYNYFRVVIITLGFRVNLLGVCFFSHFTMCFASEWSVIYFEKSILGKDCTHLSCSFFFYLNICLWVVVTIMNSKRK